VPYGYNILFLDEVRGRSGVSSCAVHKASSLRWHGQLLRLRCLRHLMHLRLQGWSKKDGQIIVDAFGRPTPNTDLYPSAKGGLGFAPLTKALGERGIQLGLWFMRGVPRRAAASFAPIYGSANATAADAVRFDKNCFWSISCYGSNYPAPAAVQYYASVASLLNSWDVAWVKADCFFPNLPATEPQPNGYFDEDVEGFSSAMAAAGISVMFSPGISVTLANASYMARARRAVSYRVTEDLWDLWQSADDGTFPTGIKQKLTKAELFSPFIGSNGTFPDLDMLPFGTMWHASKEKGVHGPASPTRLTRDEQVTAMSLWCITRAPLILGARLPLDSGDDFTLALVTNPEILYVQNSTTENLPLALPSVDQHAWTAVPAQCPPDALGRCIIVALFNAADAAAVVSVDLSVLGLGSRNADFRQLRAAAVKLCVRDLWARQLLPGLDTEASSFSRQLPAHGAGAYLLWRTDVDSDGTGECSSGDISGAPPDM
jgi:alpha-galactosidase